MNKAGDLQTLLLIGIDVGIIFKRFCLLLCSLLFQLYSLCASDWVRKFKQHKDRTGKRDRQSSTRKTRRRSALQASAGHNMSGAERCIVFVNEKTYWIERNSVRLTLCICARVTGEKRYWVERGVMEWKLSQVAWQGYVLGKPNFSRHCGGFVWSKKSCRFHGRL